MSSMQSTKKLKSPTSGLTICELAHKAYDLGASIEDIEVLLRNRHNECLAEIKKKHKQSKRKDS